MPVWASGDIHQMVLSIGFDSKLAKNKLSLFNFLQLAINTLYLPKIKSVFECSLGILRVGSTRVIENNSLIEIFYPKK